MIMKFKKGGKSLMAVLITASMIFSQSLIAYAADTSSAGTSYSTAQNKAKSTGYKTIVVPEEWGPAVTKVVVDLGQTIKQGTVSNDTFSVFVNRVDNRLANPELGSGYRTITNTYVSDANGNSAATGNYATVEMEIGPTIALSSPFNYNFEVGTSARNAWIDYNVTITQEKDIVSDNTTVSRLVADKQTDREIKGVDDFELGKGTYDNITFRYASYTPAQDNKKNPLIIWLHGGGEGGNDGTIPVAAAEVSNLISKDVQGLFGGAYVLAPQAPTLWMEGNYGTLDGRKATSLVAGTITIDGTSIYEKGLMELIKDYVSKTPDIDTSRIYIGGCSNGGYMTLVMTRDNPGYFAAAYPVCEGLADSLITDADLQNIAKTPTWFTCAATDQILPPSINTIPTYKRLVKADDKNVYFTYLDKVVDTNGLYKNSDGTPFEYSGHFSWINFFNNDAKATVNGKNTTIMEWMAAQKK